MRKVEVTMKFFENNWHYILIALTIIIWISINPVYAIPTESYTYILGAYFFITLIAYSIIRKLKIKILCLGALFTFYGLLLNLLACITHTHLSIIGHVISLAGIIIISAGLYKVIQLLENDNKKIRYLSFHDPLTGLYNRRYFENEMKRLNKSRRIPISIIVIDIDGLKIVNDTYGHKKGDEYIKETGKIIDSITRKEDIVARIGGDEFAVILPETDTKTVNNFCEQLNIRRCRHPHNLDICEDLSFTAGCATKINSQTSLGEIFIKADKNMYSKKSNK